MNQGTVPAIAQVNHRNDTERKVRVCFVLAYRAPDYIRGNSLCAALAQSPQIELQHATNISTGARRYLEMLRRLVRLHRSSPADVYILGFRGHEVGWLVRCITRGTPLILDAMMSPYAALKEERKLGWAGRWLAPVWYRYERHLLHSCEAVLTDTDSHSKYYCETFGLPQDKVSSVPVGAVEVLPQSSHNRSRSSDADVPVFRVLFYGSFLPLHGISVILEAASHLRELPIEFHFIGGTSSQGRDLVDECRRREIENYTYRPWVPFDSLLKDEIPGADLCLGGPFGATPQAQRVITGKTSQCLAMGKATVIGRIDEDHGFIDRVNCLLVKQGDAVALANSIRWSYLHREKLAEIGRHGRDLYEQRLSITSIAERLQPLVTQLAACARLSRER